MTNDRLPVPRETPLALFDIRAECALPDDFERFWSLYPRKVSKDSFGRSDSASKSWHRARKHADASAIIEGLQAWLVYWEAEHTEERFLPHPVTWLNQRRWETPPRVQRREGAWSRALAAARDFDERQAERADVESRWP